MLHIFVEYFFTTQNLYNNNNNNNGPNGHLFYVGGDLMTRRGMLPIIMLPDRDLCIVLHLVPFWILTIWGSVLKSGFKHMNIITINISFLLRTWWDNFRMHLILEFFPIAYLYARRQTPHGGVWLDVSEFLTVSDNRCRCCRAIFHGNRPNKTIKHVIYLYITLIFIYWAINKH